LEWEGLGKALKEVEKSIQWVLGDWLKYGVSNYPDKYSQALEATDYEYGTLRNAKYVASSIELSCRHDNLSFEHHYQVASLKPDDQKIWLDKAEQNNLTTS